MDAQSPANPSPTAIEMITAIFDQADTGRSALRELRQQQADGGLTIDDLLFIVRRHDGQLEARDMQDVTAGQGALVGTVSGALFGLVAGLPGLIVGAVAGALTGSASAAVIHLGVPREELEPLAARIPVDGAALIAIVDTQFGAQARRALSGFGARFHDLTMPQAASEQLRQVKRQTAETPRISPDNDPDAGLPQS